MKNTSFCIFDKAFNLESAIGALRVYLPCDGGFVNYNIAHSVREDRVCDTWRLSQAFAFDKELEKSVLLSPRAEWDMALHIKDRDDFIGGELHGDEIFTDMRLFLDGCETSYEKITELTEFSTLTVQVKEAVIPLVEARTPGQQILHHLGRTAHNELHGLAIALAGTAD